MKIQYLTFSLLSPFVCNWVSGASVEDSNKNEVTERLLPNVIIIYADDLGYGDLQCYGAKNIETPNVNKLADEGLRFTNMHAVAATSTPSRYSLLTGEYAWRKKGTDVAAGNAGTTELPLYRIQHTYCLFLSSFHKECYSRSIFRWKFVL